MVLCPGERGPRPRHDAGRWSPAQRASDWEAHGETPARCVRPAPRASRARARLRRRRHGDTRTHACTQPRGRLPKRSMSERCVWDQARSGAMRRCRRPGGASLSPSSAAHGNEVMRLPRRASVRPLDSLEATGAAHRAPRMREVRKLDSLSAATKGPDSAHLALRVAVRQLGCDSEHGVPRLDACRIGSARMRAAIVRSPCSRPRLPRACPEHRALRRNRA